MKLSWISMATALTGWSLCMSTPQAVETPVNSTTLNNTTANFIDPFDVELGDHRVSFRAAAWSLAERTLSKSEVAELQALLRSKIDAAYAERNATRTDPVPANLIAVLTEEEEEDLALYGVQAMGRDVYEMKWGDVELVDLAMSYYLRGWDVVKRRDRIEVTLYQISRTTGMLSSALVRGILEVTRHAAIA